MVRGRGLIEQRFGVRYHNHHIPRLLNQLGFSVQRPRKRLARADAEAQAVWLRDKFPATKKSDRLSRRHAVLTATFEGFNANPASIAGHVARFL